jgi:hypothetical protein
LVVDAEGSTIMVVRIVKVICFVLVAAFCGFAGGIALFFLNYDLPAGAKAQDVRRALEQLKDIGPRIEEFRRSENRLPTVTEVSCNLKPCEQGERAYVRLVPEKDGSFSLIHTSPGVMFTPASNMDTTWHSRDGTTNRDGWDQAWRWHLRYFSIGIVELIVVLLPWGYLLIRHLRKGRPRHVEAA